MRKTVFLIGPSGIGKSPLDHLFSHKVYRIDPYRLRDQPRNEKDLFFGNQKLKEDFELILAGYHEEVKIATEKTSWYPKSKVAIFLARTTWQVLPLLGFTKDPLIRLSKAEIYGQTVLHHFGVTLQYATEREK